MSGGRASQRGFALLIVLWSLGLLALLGTQLLASGRLDTQIAGNLRDAAALQTAADGAVQQAIFANLDRSNQHWAANGLSHLVRVGRVPVTVRVDDEGEKINPNIASAALLQALLVTVGVDRVMAANVAASIDEWRLASGAATRVAAITARYVAARRDYAPSGAPFTSIDDLRPVLGMTPDLLSRLRPHLTVFTDSDPDMATQDPVVAQALVLAGQGGTAGDVGAVELLSITADARGPRGTHYGLHVVARVNARTDGRRYEILVHERSANNTQ